MKLDLRRSSRWPILAGTMLTGAIFLIFVLSFVDNPAGFRKAEAFAALLSACFSGIAAIWIVVTVIRQGEELALQREELALQRGETKRLADEAAEQAHALAATTIIQAQNTLLGQMLTFAQRNENELIALDRELRSIACHHAAPEQIADVLQNRGGSIHFGRKGAICNIANAQGTWCDAIIPWPTVLQTFNPDMDSWHSLVAMAQSAARGNLGSWWRDVLAPSIQGNNQMHLGAARSSLLAALFCVEPGLIPS